MGDAFNPTFVGNQQAKSKKKSALANAMTRRVKGGAITKAIESARSPEFAIRQKYIRVPGASGDYDLVDELGAKVRLKHSEADTLRAQSGIGNYNLIDWRIQEILQSRGVLPSGEFGSGVPASSITLEPGHPRVMVAG